MNLTEVVTSMKQIITFFKSQTVLAVAGLAAIISMFFVPPCAAYIDYIDFRTLALLFSLMTVVAGLSELGVFSRMAQVLCGKCKGLWPVSVCLILLCFFSSMAITNDVALITFVPFAILVLTQAKQEKHILYVVVLQTAAANLGSMLTPVGNPQNLYLYSKFAISAGEFFGVTAPLTLVGLLGILLLTLPIRKAGKAGDTGSWESGAAQTLKFGGKMAAYLLLFAICLGTVFHLVHWVVMLAVVLLYLLFCDRALLKKADYPLLLTFVCFFVFVGNIGQIEQVKSLLADILVGRELGVSIILSQGISNVPAAVMLSGFTDNWRGLIAGTNVGGLGTLIASLASLISFQRYTAIPGADGKRYLLVFTLVNVLLLIPMVLAAGFVC